MFFFSSRRRHTRLQGDWSSDVCSSDLRASVRAATGFDLTPDSLHRLGVAVVSELEGEMRTITRRSFGTADVALVLGRLRRDPAYTFRTGDEMLQYARAALARAQAATPRWF